MKLAEIVITVMVTEQVWRDTENEVIDAVCDDLNDLSPTLAGIIRANLGPIVAQVYVDGVQA